MLLSYRISADGDKEANRHSLSMFAESGRRRIGRGKREREKEPAPDGGERVQCSLKPPVEDSIGQYLLQ